MDTFQMENKAKKQRFDFVVEFVARSSISFFVTLFSHSFHLFCFYVSILALLHQSGALAQHAPPPPAAYQQQQIEVAPAQHTAGGIGTPMPVAVDEYVPESDEQSTGRLNQFQGFYTPRPLPAGAQFTFASVWASWSAWSFCSGGVQMRVRACNTVRGFSCLGPNREVQPCEELRFHPSSGHKQRFRESVVTPEPTVEDEATNIYRANDPWAEDRQEAMRQLSSRNREQAVKTTNLPSGDDQMPAQNEQTQQNAVPTMANLGEPVNVKQGGTLKQIKDSIQMAQQQYWALSGQHAHMGTVEWGGTKNQEKQQNTKKKQQQPYNNSEDISPKALSTKIERLTPMERDNLAKQLVNIEDRLQKTERKLQQKEQKLPTPTTLANSIATATVSTAPPSPFTTVVTKAQKTVEDITREWWKENKEKKHGAEQQRKPGRQPLHSDGGQKAVVEELTESAEFVASSAEEMPPNGEMSSRTSLSNSNGGFKTIASSEIGGTQSTVVGTPALNSAGAASPSDGTSSSSAKTASASALMMMTQNRKRPSPPTMAPQMDKISNATPTKVPPVVPMMPRYQQAVRNLTGRPLGRLDARQRTIVAVMEQKRKQFRKEGDMATATAAAEVPSPQQKMPKPQQKPPETMPQGKNRSGSGRPSADQLSVDTAQALEWMLANMTKSVEVVRHQSTKGGSSKKLLAMANGDDNGAETEEDRDRDQNQHGATAADEVQKRRPSVVFPSKQFAKLRNPSGGTSAAVVVRPALAGAKSRGADAAGDQFVMATAQRQPQQQQNAKSDNLNVNSRAFAPGKPLRIGPGWDEEESGEETTDEQKVGDEDDADAERDSAATSTAKALERHRKRIITELARAQSVVGKQQTSGEKQQKEKHASPISMELEIGRLRAELSTMEQQMGQMRGRDRGGQRHQNVPGEQPQRQQNKQKKEEEEREEMGSKSTSGTMETSTKLRSTAAGIAHNQQQAIIPASSQFHSGSGTAARSNSGKKSENFSAKMDGNEEEEDYGEEEDGDNEEEEGDEQRRGNANRNGASGLKSAFSTEKSSREQPKGQQNAKGNNGTGTNYEIGPVRIGEAMVVQPATVTSATMTSIKTTTKTLERSNSRNIGNEVTTNVENENSVWTMDGMGSRHGDKAQWTDWGPWGECICGKQMRSRVCHYEQHSNGCSGRSYEVRQCAAASSSHCPTTRPPVPPSRRNTGDTAAAAPPMAQSNGILRLRHLLWRRSK